MVPRKEPTDDKAPAENRLIAKKDKFTDDEDETDDEELENKESQQTIRSLMKTLLSCPIHLADSFGSNTATKRLLIHRTDEVIKPDFFYFSGPMSFARQDCILLYLFV